MANKFLQADNVTIFNNVRKMASLDFQNRIPEVTKGSLREAWATMDQYTPLYNEFLDVLLGRIGLTLFRENAWSNTLKPFKRGMMQYGSMIQEIGYDLIKAEAYDSNATNVFEQNRPEVVANYHRINRRDVYHVTVNPDLLEEAFLGAGQLDQFVNSLLALPTQSAEQDEYLIMKDVFDTMYADGYIANVQVGDIRTASDPEAVGKQIATAMRTHYMKMCGFRNTQYNSMGLPVVSRDVTLLATPEFLSAFDVNVLAAAFNLSKADFIAEKTIAVDSFRNAGTQAMLVDSDGLVCADTLVKAGSIYNPKADCMEYYYHVQGIYSGSLMKNMLAFSTDATTLKTAAAPKTVQSVAVTAPANDAKVVEPGANIQLTADVTYSDASTDKAVTWLLTGTDEPVPGDTDTGTLAKENQQAAFVIHPDTGTYVDRMGVLHVSDQAVYSVIEATAYAADDPTKFATVKLLATDTADQLLKS